MISVAATAGALDFLTVAGKMTMVMTMATRTRIFTAAEFKARCLKLMDEVSETGEPVTITKRGKVIARLVPAGNSPKTLLGFMGGKIESVGDIIRPVDVEWDALRGDEP